MIELIKDSTPKTPDDYKKLIFYTVKTNGYNKNTFRKSLDDVIKNPNIKPENVNNEYKEFIDWLWNFETRDDQYLQRAKYAVLDGNYTDKNCLIIASFIYEYLKKWKTQTVGDYTPEEYRNAIFKIVKNSGYDPNKIVGQLDNVLKEDNSEYADDVRRMNSWIQNSAYNGSSYSRLNEFQFNALRIWEGKDFKSPYNKKLAANAVKTYLYYRGVGKRNMVQGTDDFSIGDRIEVGTDDFVIIKQYWDVKGFNSQYPKWVYQIRYNGMIFNYDGALSPQELETVGKITANVADIKEENGTKIVKLKQARLKR